MEDNKNPIYIEELTRAIESNMVARKSLVIIQPILPEVVNKALSQYRVKLFIKTTNSDQWLTDSIIEILEENPYIELMDKSSSETMTVVLDALSAKERTIPSSTETIRYAQHEVNLISAALLMPRNATYMFDRVSGGIAVDYRFNIRISLEEENILSDRVNERKERIYINCTNQRIVNVFGGVSRADFIANQHMGNICSVGSMPSNPADLLDEIAEDIANVIVSSPKIAHIIEFGR